MLFHCAFVNCKNMHDINNIQIKAILTCQCHAKRECKFNVSVPSKTWIAYVSMPSDNLV